MQPTYEGLKRQICTPSKLTTMCLQPTYEGLKPGFDHPALLQYCKFAAYLRGIETGSPRTRQRTDRGLQPTYEGLKPGYSPHVHGANWCLQPTYEGLKPTCRSSFMISPAKFAAYLRGIETGPPQPVVVLAILFAAYLRGIETDMV